MTMKKTKRLQREKELDEALDAGDEHFQKLIQKKNGNKSGCIKIDKRTRMEFQVLKEDTIKEINGAH